MAGHGHHIVPKKILYRVFGGLVALTVLTVITAEADFGPLNFIHIPLALGIAGAKTFLVVMFFMALKYDNPVNLLTFLTGVVFVAIFITFTLFDTVFRGDLDNSETLTVMEMDAQNEAILAREPNPEDLLVAPADYEAAAARAAEMSGEELQEMEAEGESVVDTTAADTTAVPAEEGEPAQQE